MTWTEIGRVASPFRERFGIPRQAALIPNAIARVVFTADVRDALEGLDGFSHAWLLYRFHTIAPDHAKAKVRPPRLDGATRVGALATRSPHRPNPIGLSLVEIVSVDVDAAEPTLRFRGCDLLDQTPILDVKPYVEYADRPQTPVRSGWLGDVPRPEARPVRFAESADASVDRLDARYPGLRGLITQMIGLDPRPATQRTTDKAAFGARLYDLDVRWVVDDEHATVVEIEELRS